MRNKLLLLLVVLAIPIGACGGNTPTPEAVSTPAPGAQPTPSEGADQTTVLFAVNEYEMATYNDLIDETGEELWAFIPPSLLPNLKILSGDSIEFSVDGAPKVHFGTDKTVLIFGLRRGGDRYFALDITERLSLKFLWEIGPSTAGFG